MVSLEIHVHQRSRPISSVTSSNLKPLDAVQGYQRYLVHATQKIFPFIDSVAETTPLHQAYINNNNNKYFI